MVKVADASMVCSQPVGAREGDIEGVIHVAEDGDVGIEKDNGIVRGKLENTELRPCIFEAGCDKSRFVAGRREKWFCRMDSKQRIMLRLEL